MEANLTAQGTSGMARQFSVFTANRLGQLHELSLLLASHGVHVLALAVLDSTDTAIIRLVVDDPDRARELFNTHNIPFSEMGILVVEVDSTVQLTSVMAALLEAELNVNYLYSFIPHPRGKSLLAFSMENNEIAEDVLRRRQFRVLGQADISR
jgi:hypothetical protein